MCVCTRSQSDCAIKVRSACGQTSKDPQQEKKKKKLVEFSATLLVLGVGSVG